MVATLRGRQQMLSMEVAEGPEGPEDVTAFQRDGLVLEFSSTASEPGWQGVVPAWQVYVPTPPHRAQAGAHAGVGTKLEPQQLPALQDWWGQQ